jgi:hypothetical protein
VCVRTVFIDAAPGLAVFSLVGGAAVHAVKKQPQGKHVIYKNKSGKLKIPGGPVFPAGLWLTGNYKTCIPGIKGIFLSKMLK